MSHGRYSPHLVLAAAQEIARSSKIRPERPMTVSTIAASLGITGSPMSAATAAVISTDLLGGQGIELKDIMLVCIPASFIAILVAAFVQNRVGKELDADPVYQQRVREGVIDPEAEKKALVRMVRNPNPRAKWSVLVFLTGVFLVVLFGSLPSLRPSFEVNGTTESLTHYPFLFSVALFIMSIMLFSQAAAVRTLFPLAIGLGIQPLALVAMFPAVNGYFFVPNYPTQVAAVNFDTTGTTRIGRYVLNHSFQLSGFITTFVSIGVGYLIISFLYG